MRLIAHLDSAAHARTFGDYLTSLDIANSVEPEGDGTWAIWVQAEEKMEAGQAALREFKANPDAPKFLRASEKAATIKADELRQKAEYAKRIVTKDSLWPQYSLGPVTIILILCSVAVAVFYGFVPYESAPFLWMSTQSATLPEIRSGQYWRLVTPIFIHMNFMHIFFNMLWLKDLGSLIESRKGSVYLLILVLVVAIGSNLGEDIFGVGPGFGGMSGVLYGLFGFIWLRSKLDPTSGLRLAPADVVMMIGWYFLCVFHVIGDVANACHTFGLIIGMFWGAAPPLVKKLLKN